LAYNPPFVNAEIGDTLHFTFRQKNHTVTQSTFADPCKPMDGGFKSGFLPVPDSMTDGFPSCDWDVKTKGPLWVYCQQANHCAQGMVFAVNPPTTGDNTYEKFVAAAKASTSQAPAGGDPYGSSPPPPPASSGSAPASPPATPSSSGTPPAASGNILKVTVGGPGGLIFNPSRVDAKMGDTVRFEFHSKNHTVTQSTFAQPCTKLDAAIASTPAVFDSGYQPSNETGPFPTYDVPITTTAAMWFYCAQGNHCSQGMVFAINSVESSANNYNAFVAKAKGGSATSGNSSTPQSTPNGAVGRMAISVGTTIGVVGAVAALLL
jgi:plastocyanin